MNKQTNTVKTDVLRDPPKETAFVDKETGYRFQVWKQMNLQPSACVYVLFYWRNGKWRRGSAQMLDRNLRRLGLGSLTDCPWGPGPEMGFAVDDMIVANGGPVGVATAARADGLGEG